MKGWKKIKDETGYFFEIKYQYREDQSDDSYDGDPRTITIWRERANGLGYGYKGKFVYTVSANFPVKGRGVPSYDNAGAFNKKDALDVAKKMMLLTP